MNNSEYKYSAETGKIIGLAIEVHKTLGCGFPEVIYQRALEKELLNAKIPFIREYEMSIFYKGEKIGSRRVDFFIYEKISVELKAISELEEVHFNQALNYLEALKQEIGLLFNFGSKSLETRRLINSKTKSRWGFNFLQKLFLVFKGLFQT